MDDRLVAFVRGLRLAGVRVSVAEAQDALRALSVTGIGEREQLRSAFRATLVKSSADFAAFDTLFPLYFGSDGPPLHDAREDLSPEDRQLLEAALEALTGRLRKLLDWLTSGTPPTAEE